jgi:hypothetical protein
MTVLTPALMTFSKCGLVLLIQSPVTVRPVSIQGVLGVITRTGAEEVVIYSMTERGPSFLSAYCSSLAVQPGGEVRGITRGTAVGNIVDVPLSGKGRKDLAIADALGPTAVKVGSGICALKDLCACYESRWGKGKPP